MVAAGPCLTPLVHFMSAYSSRRMTSIGFVKFCIVELAQLTNNTFRALFLDQVLYGLLISMFILFLCRGYTPARVRLEYS
jgi:hypothetical protein